MEQATTAEAKNALEKVKKTRKVVLRTENADSQKGEAYRRISISKVKTAPVDKDQASLDIAILAQARVNIMNILENDYKLENFTYNQKQGMLYFLNKYLLYLRSSVALKTKFMTTSLSFTLPSDLRLGAFQKRAILDFHKGLMDKLEGVLYSLFYNYNLYNTAYLLSTDNWNDVIKEKLDRAYEDMEKASKSQEKDKNPVHPLLKRVIETLLSTEGLTINDMFKYFEKNPQSAERYFTECINIYSNPEFKKLEELFNLDEGQVSLEDLEKMRKMAFPLLDGLEFLDMCRPYDPACLGESTYENIDTGSLRVDLNKSETLIDEVEYKELQSAVKDFTDRFGTEPDESADGYKEAREELEKRCRIAISKLVFKGYSKPWVEAHVYSNNEKKIEVSNDSFLPIHIFRMKSFSTLEDESNADSLIEPCLDLYSCEVRQRSWINDMRDKLVSITINAAAEANLGTDVISSIIEDIATIIANGEASVISIPDGISLTDHTDIIRASNDTDKLSIQSKNNIALFFGMSTSLLEDSETQFSNVYLKTDTAQNVFSQEREVIIRLIEDKILRPASVKAGFFCKNDQGRVVVACPKIKFNRISIGRHSEDYNDLKALVDEGTMPKEKLYEYHNTSKEEVTSKLIEDALSLDNPDILKALSDKVMNLISEDKSGNIVAQLIKGDVTTLLKILTKKSTPEDALYASNPDEKTTEGRTND